MINPCTCTKGGASSSTKPKKTKRTKNPKPCKNCSKTPITESKNMLTSANNNLGLDLPRAIEPCVNWKTNTRGRQRAVRRARTSFTSENKLNNVTIRENSSNGSDNCTDEELKGIENQVPVSEFEKFGVTILGRRFSDAIKNVPIKKRRCMLITSFEEKSLLSDNNNNNHIDFSGISILADAACETDMLDNTGTKFSVPESQQPYEGQNGNITPLKDDSQVVNKGENGDLVKNESLEDKLCKDEAKDSLGFKWDLNTVMDTWDCDEQTGFVTDVAGENLKKEGLDGGDVKLTCDDKEVKDDIMVEFVNETKETIVESNVTNTQVELNGVDLSLLSQPSVSKEEEENEINPNNQSCVYESELKPGNLGAIMEEDKPADISTINEPSKLDLEVKPELVSEACTNLPDDAIMQLNPSILANVVETPNDEKVAATEDPISGGEGELSNDELVDNIVMNKNENDGVSLDVSKNKKRGFNEDYQYEDGELREQQPIVDYWANDEKEEEDETKSEHVAICVSDQLEENHYQYHNNNNNMVQPAQNDDGDLIDAPVVESLDPLPQGENENEVGPEIKDNWDFAILENKPDSENNDEWGNNCWAVTGEGGDDVSGSSPRVKRTGWDRLPPCSDRDSSPLGSPKGRPFRPRSSDGPRGNNKPFVRPRRSEDDENSDSRPFHRRADGAPRHLVIRQKDSKWARPGPTRHKSPPEFAAPSFAPSNSGNATAASIAKVKNNGFVVAPDGTLVKASVSGGGPTRLERERGKEMCLSRERELSPPHRFHRSRDLCTRRGGHVKVIHMAASRSRSRTRSPNGWRPPPPCRAGPTFNHHHHVSPPRGSTRWVDERRRRSPPPRVHSPPLPRGLRGSEFFHHHHHHPQVHHVTRCNREYEDGLVEMSVPHNRHFERGFNGGFRPRNKMTEFQRRGFDRSRVNREDRDCGFRFQRGRGRGRGRNNAAAFKRYDKRNVGGSGGEENDGFKIRRDRDRNNGPTCKRYDVRDSGADDDDNNDGDDDISTGKRVS